MTKKRTSNSSSNNKSRSLTQEQVGKKYGFRSGLEELIANQLTDIGISFSFESFKIEYMQPAKKRSYTPDFLLPNGIIIETKGRFLTADRQKHLWVQKQYPDLDIRFVFSNSKQKIRKGSKTTYAMWCEKNGFLYADREIPQAWLKERPKQRKKKR